MIGIVAIFVAPFVLGLFALGVNFAVWRQRPSERGHLALAAAGAAGLLVLGAAGLIYAADSRGDAIVARSAWFLCAIPIQIANVRLVERIYQRPMRLHYWTGAGLSALWALVGAIPGALYGDGTVLREAVPLGFRYVDVALTGLGRIAPLSLVPGVVGFAWATDRAMRPDTDRSTILPMMLLSSGLACADLATNAGLLDVPYLYGVSCAVAAILYTGLLLRRFVETLGRVEASAELLQRAAEARARELRESDLQLAQGVRLAALGTLAAGLAHEINNPVAFIRSNLNYLAEIAESGGDDPEVEEVLAETEEGVRRLRGIVDELLRMSASGSSGFAEVSLAEVVESALPTLRFEARDDVALEARLAPIPAVRGDRNLLGQVVANLVLNAIQAVRGAGSPGAVRISTFADDVRAVLEVTDSGPGVAPEVAQRIFDPFFTTKPPGQGTGLGLAVSRQLVERHGGKLSLMPSERGARFRVELPLARVAQTPRPASFAEASA